MDLVKHGGRQDSESEIYSPLCLLLKKKNVWLASNRGPYI